jgi:phospholipid transport system substrate-binding protein
VRTALILLVLLAAGPSATQALRDRDAEIRAALPPPGQVLSEPGRRSFEAVVARVVDTRQMLESAMGARWAKMTPKDRQRLQTAFEHRFRMSGASQFDSMREAKVEYLGETPKGSNVVVATRLQLKDETSDVSYLMTRVGGSWHIIDVIIDGVSTVENYRSSFARIIDREGLDGLIRRLERGGESKG